MIDEAEGRIIAGVLAVRVVAEVGVGALQVAVLVVVKFDLTNAVLPNQAYALLPSVADLHKRFACFQKAQNLRQRGPQNLLQTVVGGIATGHPQHLRGRAVGFE